MAHADGIDGFGQTPENLEKAKAMAASSKANPPPQDGSKNPDFLANLEEMKAMAANMLSTPPPQAGASGFLPPGLLGYHYGFNNAIAGKPTSKPTTSKRRSVIKECLTKLERTAAVISSTNAVEPSSRFQRYLLTITFS